MIVFGSRLMGRCDDVPGMFHVATKCYHIDYIPLAPIQSYIVLSRNGTKFNGVKIPLSLKSFGLAWLRFLGWAGLVAGIIILIVGFTSHQPPRPEEYIPGFFVIGVAALFLGLAYFFKPLKVASYQRAMALAKLASLNEAGFEQLNKIYGQGFPVIPKSAAVPNKSAGVRKSPQAL